LFAQQFGDQELLVNSEWGPITPGEYFGMTGDYPFATEDPIAYDPWHNVVVQLELDPDPLVQELAQNIWDYDEMYPGGLETAVANVAPHIYASVTQG